MSFSSENNFQPYVLLTQIHNFFHYLVWVRLDTNVSVFLVHYCCPKYNVYTFWTFFVDLF